VTPRWRDRLPDDDARALITAIDRQVDGMTAFQIGNPGTNP